MSLENEQCVISNEKIVDQAEKSLAKKRKASKIFAILAFTFSIIGWTSIEVITVCNLLGTLVSTLIASLVTIFSGAATFMSLLAIPIYLVAPILTMIAQLLALIPCVLGLIFTIISLVLNRKVKEHTSTVLGAMAMPFALMSTLAILRNIISWLIIAIFVIGIIAFYFTLIIFVAFILLIFG